jgi:hypothetical protein
VLFGIDAPALPAARSDRCTACQARGNTRVACGVRHRPHHATRGDTAARRGGGGCSIKYYYHDLPRPRLGAVRAAREGGVGAHARRRGGGPIACHASATVAPVGRARRPHAQQRCRRSALFFCVRSLSHRSRSAMEQINNAKQCLKATYKVMTTDPPRTLRWLSTGSGILLILGGLSGALNPFSIIHPLSMIISVYNVLFGVLIVLTELKTFPIIKTFQKRVDVYFHLLSVPRGKGGFYCFIGFLAFFSSTDDSQTLSRICVLIVSVVGVLHLLACKRCGGKKHAWTRRSSNPPEGSCSF